MTLIFNNHTLDVDSLQRRNANLLPHQLLLVAVFFCLTDCSYAPIREAYFPFKILEKTILHIPNAGRNFLSQGDSALALAWSSDGEYLAVASDFGQQITVWNRRGKLKSQFSTKVDGPLTSRSIAFGQQPSLLIYNPPAQAGLGVALAVWDVDTGRPAQLVAGPCTRQVGPPAINQADNYIITPDKKYLILSTPTIGVKIPSCSNVAVYNTRDWSILTAYDVEEPVNVINLDQDGKVILFGLGNGNITSVTATGPQRRKTYNVYPQSKYGQVDVVAVAGSPDGKFLLAGGSAGYMTIEDASRETAADRQIQKIPVRVIRADDGQVVASFNELSEVEQAEWDPKGRYVALVDYARHLCIWTPILPKQGYACIILPGVGFTLSISPDGGQIAAIADQDVLIFNIK